jgi:threonine dehydrogenase-like Zn-dependent dehydrogenase
MKTVEQQAKWNPVEGFVPDARDIVGKLTYFGSKVWSDPKLKIVDRPIPKIGPTEVLLKIRACGICGTDVHMLQTKADGRIMYPGLTAFPCVTGHELSGTVVEAGELAIDKLTGKRFKEGSAVCAEEMLWCGRCRPCVDGYPNHCEALQEIGITVDGAFAEYMKIDAKYCWSLEPLNERYSEDQKYLAGSLVEPNCVAYNAVIVRGGGISPGDYVVILGAGPIGLGAMCILKRMGARKVIVSEPNAARAKMAEKMGADVIINPAKEDFVSRILKETDGMGAKLYLEATGLPRTVWPGIETAIWKGRGVNATVVIVARADAKIEVTGEVFQVRRAQIVGAQGHSGHGTFPRVINLMAGGMDMTPMVTKKITLDEVPENVLALQKDLTNCKISYVAEK